MKAINDSNKSETLEGRVKTEKKYISRRSFLGKTIALGAGTMGGAGIIHTASKPQKQVAVFHRETQHCFTSPAALELLEADFWIR